jgi:hypothetical protein
MPVLRTDIAEHVTAIRRSVAMCWYVPALQPRTRSTAMTVSKDNVQAVSQALNTLTRLYEALEHADTVEWAEVVASSYNGNSSSK